MQQKCYKLKKLSNQQKGVIILEKPMLVNLVNSAKKLFEKNLKKNLQDANVPASYGPYLMCLLHHSTGLTLTELTKAVSCNKANTTRVINDLIALGFIKKDDDQKVKKYKLVLTPLGYQKALIVKEALEKVYQKAFKGFSKIEKENKKNYIVRFLTNLNHDDK